MKIILIATVLVAIFLMSSWFWYAHTIKTLTLSDLEVQSCDQLPNLSELDTLFASNQPQLSKLLDNLSSCTNNVDVCNQYSKCKKEDYLKRRISSGNTIIEWKIIPECKNQNKGGVLISYSSGCEIQVIQNFKSTNLNFYSMPMDWYNY